MNSVEENDTKIYASRTMFVVLIWLLRHFLLTFQSQFQAIVKAEDPKAPARAWDEDDQFDHVLPLHQILQRYKTDTIKVTSMIHNLL